MPLRPIKTPTKNAAPTDGASPPRLRFPKFAGRHIRSVTLGEVTEDCTDRNGTTATGLPVMGVSKTHGIVPMEERLIGKDTARYKRLEFDWFAYNPMRLNIGSIARWRGEGSVLVSPDYVVFRCLDEEPYALSPDYLDQFRSSTHWEHFVTGSGDGGVRVRIYYSDLARLRLGLPDPSEQQRIADCLTSLDEAIAAQGRKVEALKAHKKGLMQQLFPQSGERVPPLRFPEFRDGPEWKYENIEQFAAITTGDKDTQDKVDSGRYPFFVRSQTVQRSDSYSLDTEAVLTSGDGVGVGDDYHYIKGKFDFHQRVYCIHSFRKDVSGLFFYAYFAEHFRARVGQMSAKNSVDSVRRAMIAEMPVALPSLPEQQRIADCLTSLDAAIAAASAALTALKAHKKGLMQGLFPETEGA